MRYSHLTFISIFVSGILFTISTFGSTKYCDYAPFQRADADIPVHEGLVAIPNNPNVIAHVVEYGTEKEHVIPRDTNNSRLHTHIWLVDTQQCKKLAVLPIPPHASINVHAVDFDSHALPVKLLEQGKIELKYAYAIPENKNSLIVRRVVLDSNWQLLLKQDIIVTTNRDARKIANLADWEHDGNLLDLSELIEKDNYLHHLIKFNDGAPTLYQFKIRHPEAHMTSEGILFDETRPYKPGQYYPLMALITSFDPTIKYYRQFVGNLPNLEADTPHYIYPKKENNITLFQLGDKYINNQGVVVATGKPLDDYNKSDQLMPETITSYRWQSGQWVKDDSLQPQRLMAKDILNHLHNWPN